MDLVAGDFNGAAWRRDNSNSISIIEEAIADCALPMPPGPTPLWGPGAVPGTWADVCGFLKPTDSDGKWKVPQHGAFPFSSRSSGHPPDRSELPSRGMAPAGFCGTVQRSITSRKTRSTTYHYQKTKYPTGGDASDHSLSSLTRQNFATNVSSRSFSYRQK